VKYAANLLALSLIVLFALPLIALVAGGSFEALVAGLHNPLVLPALALSARTTAIGLTLIVLLGTPLAWRLARSPGRWTHWVEPLVELPIVIPPAVIGVALLLTFGRQGLLGGLQLNIPFTTAAVVLAQVVVAAPFYVRAATATFRALDAELLLVARTLGASPARTFFRVALPCALPGLLSGAGLAAARAMGEFGATLLFAGNLPGHTQTMPLAIFSALERDVDAARALSLLLAAAALSVLISIRLVPRMLRP
jgi:molybdate transport system permease protein